MKTSICLAVICIHVSAQSPAQRAARVDAYLGKLATIGFSGGIFITSGGELVLKRAYGLADRERGTPMTCDTIMTTGSLTKQFTGAAIAKLIERGKLSLDDTLDAFFEDVPEDKKRITIRHLLTHSAGLPGAVRDDHDLGATRPVVQKAALEAKLRFAPGSRRRYSNTGYTLLAMIIEKRTGKSYEQFLREELFLPAGMKNTGYVLAKLDKAKFATGYRGGRKRETFVDLAMMEDGPNWALRGNGGILSTVDDMLAWERVLSKPGVLSEKTLGLVSASLQGGDDDGYGFGWSFIRSRRDTRMMEHDGGNQVFVADWHRYQDEGVSIFIQTSNYDLKAESVIEEVESLWFGREIAMPPTAVDVPEARLRALAGKYDLDGGGLLDVRVRGGRLRVACEDPSVLVRLRGIRLPDDATSKRCIDSTRTMTEGWTKGDYSAFARALGRKPSKARELFEPTMRQRRSMHGAFRGAIVTGATVDDDERMVDVDFRHERGAWRLRYGWRGGKLAGIDFVGTVEDVARATLFPTSKSRFESFSFGSTPVRLEFLERDGVVSGVRFLSASGRPIAARR